MSAEPGHNGKVLQHGGITVKSQWLVIDGSKGTNYSLTPLDAMTIQAYYTSRLAQTAEMPITVSKDGADIRIVAAGR